MGSEGMSTAKQAAVKALMQYGDNLVQEGSGFIQMAKTLCSHVESKIVRIPIENGNITRLENRCVDCGVKVDPK